MITKTKTSVSLSRSLLDELALFNQNDNVSDFIEKALAYYIAELKRQERKQKDIEIINANAERFNKEAEENLKFQAML
jgi:metal-responsive CopG/Arc/MetJ family transcriptional regulator